MGIDLGHWYTSPADKEISKGIALVLPLSISRYSLTDTSWKGSSSRELGNHHDGDDPTVSLDVMCSSTVNCTQQVNEERIICRIILTKDNMQGLTSIWKKLCFYKALCNADPRKGKAKEISFPYPL